MNMRFHLLALGLVVSSLLVFGCRKSGYDSIPQVTDILEEKFGFEFPKAAQIDNAELFFSERSPASSIYMKLNMPKSEFAIFRKELGERITHLGRANWGDQKVRSGLSWWDAQKMKHDQEFALSALEDPEMRKARIFFSTRMKSPDVVEIYLSSQWFVN